MLSLLFLTAGLIQAQDTILSQDFDFPAIFPPPYWTNVKVAGASLPGDWSRVTTGGGPIQEPHTDPAEAKFNSFYYLAGTSADLGTDVMNFSVTGTYTVNFWMYRDPGFGTDKVEVYVNTTQQSAGGTLIGTINRNTALTPVEAAQGWYNYIFTIPNTYNTTTNYVIFKAISGFGFNMFIDDIVIYKNPVTVPSCITTFAPASGPIDNCRNTTLNWGVVPFATGYKLTFGSNAPNYNNIVNNADLGTNLSYSSLLAANTLYKWKVRPYNNEGIAIGCVFNTLTTGANPCYCEPYYIEESCGTLDFIDDFSTTGAVVNISHLNSGCAGIEGNYNYYTAYPGQVNQGSTFNINLQSGNDYGQGYGVWADWNIDGDFDDVGEFVFQSATITTSLVSGVVTVPAIAVLGTTRLRVRCFYNYIPAAGESCSTANEGETEDYDITVTTCTFVTYYQDADSDGFGNSAVTTTSCIGVPAGYSSDNTDCNDANGTVNPGAVELCNGLDENCNFIIDENAATATITPSGPTTVCKGTNLTLYANTGTGYTYQWIRNGGNVIGATASSYNVTKSGNYQVKVTVPGGCNATSLTTACTVTANPNASISTPEGLDLCGFGNLDLVANAGTGFTYIWYKNDVIIAGEVNQTYVATTIGSYKVKVFNASGCSKKSPPKTVIASCKEGISNNALFEVYPNPANDVFNISLAMETIGSEPAILLLTDILGNIVYSENISISNGIYSGKIETSNFASGIYNVKIYNSNNQFNKQIVINK